MKFSFLNLAAVFLAGATLAAAPDWNQEIHRILKQGMSGGLSTGETPETGIYVMSVAVFPEGKAHSEALALATLRGKKEIAGFLGSSFSASDNLSTKYVEVVVDGKPENKSMESLRSEMSADINQMLKAVRVLQEVSANNRQYVVCLTTQKLSSQSTALADALREKSGPNTVGAIGIAMIENDRIDLAKGVAIANAKSEAIEQVLGTVLASTSQELNDQAFAKIFSNAAGCIKQYRILSERREGGSVYRVEIIAEVAKDELLANYRSVLDAMGAIKFFIETGDSQINTILEEKFMNWGCTITRDREAAQYIISCHGKFDENVMHPTSGLPGTRVQFRLKILDAFTADVLLAAQNDPRGSVSFILNRARQKSNAIEMAMEDIHPQIHKKLQDLIGRMAANGREVQILCENYSSSYADALQVLKDCAERMPGASQVALTIDAARREAVLSIRYQSTMDALRMYMKAEMRRAFREARLVPDEVGADANTWTVTW